MNTQHRRVYDALRRAGQFTTRHASLLGRAGMPAARRRLDDSVRAIARWTFLWWIMDVLDGTLRARIHQVRHDLRIGPMRLVVTAARARLRDQVELGALRVPKRHATCGEFILAANLFADVFTRHQEAFEAAGLASETGATLRDGADAIARDVAKRAKARASGAYWQRKIDERVRTARGDLAIMEAEIRPALARNRWLARAWRETKGGTGPVRSECVRRPWAG